MKANVCKVHYYDFVDIGLFSGVAIQGWSSGKHNLLPPSQDLCMSSLTSLSCSSLNICFDIKKDLLG